MNEDNDFFFLFLNFDTVFKKSTPENFANIWRIERVRIISAIKFELARIHFLSDVFVDVGRRCCLFKFPTNKLTQQGQAA